MKRGAVIVFEGCDNCGKSTQARLLVEFLKNKNVAVKYMAFPNRTTPSGLLLNQYLTNKKEMSDECIHLLFAANRWETHNEMKKLIYSGTTLVIDRYSYSGIAYSMAKGLDAAWCWSSEINLVCPDIVFYLKSYILPKRDNYGEERYEHLEFQMKVAHVFNLIHQTEKDYWTIIDANQDTSVIHKFISYKTFNLIKNVQNKPIKILSK